MSRQSYDDMEVELGETKARKNSYAAAHMDQASQIEAQLVEIKRYKGECEKLRAEADAARTSVQLLIDDGQTRYAAANREVERLRTLCKEHGVDPNLE